MIFYKKKKKNWNWFIKNHGRQEVCIIVVKKTLKIFSSEIQNSK